MSRSLLLLLAGLTFGGLAASLGSAAQDEGRDEGRGARIFRVGPEGEFRNPSDVAGLVRSGDTVEIAPGTYFDCAVWPARIDGLVIEGRDATIADRSCADKGLFVVSADNVTIRGITFRGAKVKDHNGAGIRAQGRNLTVENSRFIGNENGILANGVPGSTIVIRNSHFEGNGACIGECAHGIYINRIAHLKVEGCTFVETYRGHHIKSHALVTEITNNTIRDGPAGNSSYLIDIPFGGAVIITGNTLEKGPRAENRLAAISIGEGLRRRDRPNPTPEIRIEGNRFVNRLPGETVFVRNHTRTPALVRDNTLIGRVRELMESGA